MGGVGVAVPGPGMDFLFFLSFSYLFTTWNRAGGHHWLPRAPASS